MGWDGMDGEMVGVLKRGGGENFWFGELKGFNELCCCCWFWLWDRIGWDGTGWVCPVKNERTKERKKDGTRIESNRIELRN